MPSEAEKLALRGKTMRCAYCNEDKPKQAFPSSIYAQCYDCANWCWSCNEPQQMPKHPFRVCGECFHIYPTRFNLWRENWRTMWPLLNWRWRWIPRRTARIYACPKCAHDF